MLFSPLRPITKQKCLSFDNNNLSDFIKYKKKPKRKSTPLKTVSKLTSTGPPLIFGAKSLNVTPAVNPFDVSELIPSPKSNSQISQLEDDRKALQEIRLQQKITNQTPAPPTNPNPKLDHENCPSWCFFKDSKFSSISAVEAPSHFNQLATIIADDYEKLKSKSLLRDIQLMFSILPKNSKLLQNQNLSNQIFQTINPDQFNCKFNSLVSYVI